MSVIVAAISEAIRAFSASPAAGTPSAAATCVTRSSMLSRFRCGVRTTTGMPESRIWRTTSQGPIELSVRMTVGSSARMASPLSSWPFCVTRGRSAASGNPVEVSRPTTESPSPRPNTVAASDPDRSRARIRLVSLIVTSVSWLSTIVTGSDCSGASVTAVMPGSAMQAVDGPVQSFGSATGVSDPSGVVDASHRAGSASAGAAPVAVQPARPIARAASAATRARRRRGRVLMIKASLTYVTLVGRVDPAGSARRDARLRLGRTTAPG